MIFNYYFLFASFRFNVELIKQNKIKQQGTNKISLIKIKKELTTKKAKTSVVTNNKRFYQKTEQQHKKTPKKLNN